MERLRPVEYIKRSRVPASRRIISQEGEKEKRKGFYHGIVRGTTSLVASSYSQHGTYDYGLVEDEESGQLVKVELSDITFTDRAAEKRMGEMLEELFSGHATGEEAVPYSQGTNKPGIDYGAIEGKALMALTEDDFDHIEIYKTKAQDPDFEVIYYCSSDRGGKIYFTPNENSYTQRGHMLREEAEIATTEELIKAIRNWREDSRNK